MAEEQRPDMVHINDNLVKKGSVLPQPPQADCTVPFHLPQDFHIGDWNGGASTPAKATRAFLFVKRRTSPISAISFGPVTSPAPCMAMTTSYSGSRDANRFISVRRTAMDSYTAFRQSTAWTINVFVLSFWGNVATVF